MRWGEAEWEGEAVANFAKWEMRNSEMHRGKVVMHSRMFTFVMDLVILPPCQGGRRRRKGGCRHGRVCMAEERRRRRKGEVDLVFAPSPFQEKEAGGDFQAFILHSSPYTLPAVHVNENAHKI